MFKEELLDGSGNITVWINSPGGDCVAAAQIYNMLREYEGKVTVKIDGIAASAASVIAMAGDTVLMSPVSMMMIHNPMTIAFGDSGEMQRAIVMLSSVKDSIINTMIYFTSDLHLGHEAVIRMQNRPFANADEMNRVLIENYNSVVHKDDTVYLLGDICYRIGLEKANELIASLKGKKYLIQGNHDKKYEENLFEDIRDFMTISVNGLHISMMHYPMLAWPRSHYGSIMLHGHIHSDGSYNMSNKEAGIKRYDVGVDANNYMPVSIKQIENFLKLQE